MATTSILRALIHANRRFYQRLGRWIYQTSRFDLENRFQENGEFSLQEDILGTTSQLLKGAVVFDIGANVGDWSLHLLGKTKTLDASNSLSLHIFEPFPSTFKTLSSRLGGFSSSQGIYLNNLAISNADGEVNMFGRENLGTSSLYSGEIHDASSSVAVKSTTIDSYCEENGLDEIHFIKCDTEGHDFEVIRGARKTLEAEKISVFQFEYNHRWIHARRYLKDVFDFVENLPYEVAKLTPNSLEVYSKWHPELERFFEGNYVLIHPKMGEQLRTHHAVLDISNTFA